MTQGGCSPPQDDRHDRTQARPRRHRVRCRRRGRLPDRRLRHGPRPGLPALPGLPSPPVGLPGLPSLPSADTVTAPVQSVVGSLPATIGSATGTVQGTAGSLVNGLPSTLNSALGTVTGVAGGALNVS